MRGIAASRLWGFCGDLENRGRCLRHAIPSLPALSQVRGLTGTAWLAPAIGLEPITCRLTAGRSAD
jgi:hypothetical protein